jgi:RNA polymerase sigma-70 factor (ECF subfamily)
VLARDERPRLGAEGDLPEPKGSPGAAEIEDRRLRRADLARALGELPQPQREVVVLRYYLGLEEPEIALAVGIPRGTVKSRLHTAIRRMRARLTR